MIINKCHMTFWVLCCASIIVPCDTAGAIDGTVAVLKSRQMLRCHLTFSEVATAYITVLAYRSLILATPSIAILQFWALDDYLKVSFLLVSQCKHWLYMTPAVLSMTPMHFWGPVNHRGATWLFHVSMDVTLPVSASSDAASTTAFLRSIWSFSGVTWFVWCQHCLSCTSIDILWCQQH